MPSINTYIDTHKDRFIKELLELLKLPSISSDPIFSHDILETAKAVEQALIDVGCAHTEICETSGHPVVYGEKIIDTSLPTVLVYGHYDVQPPDPIELWESPPFEPIIKTTERHPQGAIFARGTSDNKAQFFMHIKALEYMTRNDQLPCNVKIIIEGEEELGSMNLETFLEENKQKLENDIILISDTTMLSGDVPSITAGIRGVSYLNVEVTGPNRDLHSGIYGGGVANPINILCKMIASLQDKDNRITIPGFYDKVKSFPRTERDAMAQAPFNLDIYKSDLNIAAVQGENGYSTLERTTIRPSLDVNGIWGGYTGEGAKTVIPSKAYAKISMRLVPNQDWREIDTLFAQHFKALAPPGVTVKVTPHHGAAYYTTPIDSIGYRAAAKAMAHTLGKAPIPKYSGGSIPIVPVFKEVLQSHAVMLGFGFESDAIHSPNEHFGVWNFLKGIETIFHFYKNYAALFAASHNTTQP